MTVAKVPQALTDPNLKLIFDQILDITGVVSPMSLGKSASVPTAPQGNPMDMAQLQGKMSAMSGTPTK